MASKRGLTFPAYPNGQYAGKNGPVTPGNKDLSGLDKSRYGSADNTSKDRPNDKKVVIGIRSK